MHRGRRWAAWVCGLVGLVGGGVLALGVGYADEAKAQCALATLKGTYLFAPQGVQIVDHDHVPFAAAGAEVYDGNGRCRGS